MLQPSLGSGTCPNTESFFVDPDGHFSGFEEMVCDDDAKATELAERLVDGHDVELWNGARLVVLLQHTSDEIRAFDCHLDESRRMAKDTHDPATSARLDQLTSDLMRDKVDQQKRDDEKK